MNPGRVGSSSYLRIGAVLAFVSILIVLHVARTSSQGIRNSTDVTKSIIERAKSNGTVDLSWLGDKTCFVAEMLYAPGFAKEWFADYRIDDDHWRDKSNGVWHLMVSNDKERVVRIYSIDQSILRWNVPEGTKVADAVGCKSTVKVMISGTSAEIFVF